MKTQKNALMSGPASNNGFSLIEVLLAIFLLGLMASLVVPTLQYWIPGYQQESFFSELNNLISLAWQNALTTQKTHRISFDFNDNVVQAEIEIPENEKTPTESYAPLVANYTKGSITWPEHLVVKEFFINGQDQLKKISTKAKKLWFFIIPDGMAQAIILNMTDKNDKEVSLVLNPFTVQLKKYDSFQRP